MYLGNHADTGFWLLHQHIHWKDFGFYRQSPSTCQTKHHTPYCKKHHIQCCVLPKGRIVCWSPCSQVSQKIQWKSSRLRRVNYRATLGLLDSSGGLNSWSLEGHRGPATKARPIVLHLQSKVGTTYWPPTVHTYCVQDYVILLLSPEHWQVGLAVASAGPDCRLVGHNRFGLVERSWRGSGCLYGKARVWSVALPLDNSKMEKKLGK